MVTTDDLIGGKWVPKSGYIDGEPSGEPVCPSYDEGIVFKDPETVYLVSEDKDFRYHLRESDEGIKIAFFNPNGEVDSFKILVENKVQLVLFQTGHNINYNCYFEREK